MNKSIIGKIGEDFCEKYYSKTGCEILSRNYHSRYGEIDLIAKKDNTLIFIEVKTRGDNSISAPSASVTKAKQKKLILTSMHFIEQYNLTLNCQFDVFEVWQNEGRVYKFNRIESAFEAEDFSGRYDIY